MDKKLVLYMHAGSGNHGCEAIVRSFLTNLRAADRDAAEGTRLITNSEAEDRKYLPEGFCSIEEERHLDRNAFAHAAYYAYRKLTRDYECYLRYRFPMLLGNGTPGLAVSIGGDNYCYPEMVPDLILADEMLRKRGARTALLGCSVEPGSLRKDAKLAADMKAHSLVIARESLTYNALLEAGLEPGRLRLIPDPAFTLERQELPLPEGFVEGNTVGLNVSPLVEKYRSGEGESAMDAFAALISHIIENTDMQIALIPHVVWGHSDDRIPLGKLYQRFSDTGRVVLIDDHPAPQLKGFIARCRFFAGARTHATIAAYSSLVPTLVVGYSVKSEGIAKDLFGTAQGNVLNVAGITGRSLIEAFSGLAEREKEARDELASKMPEIISRARSSADEIAALRREINEKG